MNPESFLALTARNAHPSFLLAETGIVVAANACGSAVLGRRRVSGGDGVALADFLAEGRDGFEDALRVWRSAGVPVNRPLAVKAPDGRRVRCRGEGVRVVEPGPAPRPLILLHCVPLEPWDCGHAPRDAAHRPVGKMEAMGNLAAGIAHDFNNLLTVMKVETELSLEHGNLPQEITDSLLSTYDAVLRAEALVEGLLAFSRRHHVHAAHTDLGSVLSGTLPKLQAAVGSARIVVERAEEALPTLIDPDRVETVLVALVRNASEASAPGASIHVRTRRESMDRTFVARNPGSRPGRYAVLEVEDHGTGITPDVQARMFEPFYTTKGRGSGRGLGLAQAFGIVKTLGGYLKVDTEPGRGSRFTVYLPLEVPDDV